MAIGVDTGAVQHVAGQFTTADQEFTGNIGTARSVHAAFPKEYGSINMEGLFSNLDKWVTLNGQDSLFLGKVAEFFGMTDQQLAQMGLSRTDAGLKQFLSHVLVDGTNGHPQYLDLYQQREDIDYKFPADLLGLPTSS